MKEKLPVLSIYPDNTVKELGDLFGVFFEDLNHAADGGLYGELIQNRSFEFDQVDNPEYHPLYAWERVERGDSAVQIHVETSQPLSPQNRHYLRVEINRAGTGGGVKNLGYAGGIWLEEGKEYEFSCWCANRSAEGRPIRVVLENETGEVCSTEASFVPEQAKWSKVILNLTAVKTGAASLYLLSDEVQMFNIDMVSLFPRDTFGNRKNGLRKDVAQMIADMKPKFMRFPGGCLVHCGSLNAEDRVSQYRWKNTLGEVEQRPSKRNSWGYNQTLGLGYYEFFCFCEDIGTQPLPVISAGWDPHTLRAVPIEQMQEWIDEALDLVEFANGGTDTKWGAVRAKMGHPTPFGLKYLGIGNEEVGDPFFERFEMVHQAVKERYPDIQLIGTSGPACDGEVFCQGWESARKMGSSYVDEHYYQSTDWMLANMHRYDSYSVDGPKAFLGEYASRDEKYYNALVEAAFMIGMEKAPGLGLACYAPMLCNADYVNWKPDMIWFDNHRVYGTPCYYVQKLFMNHQGDHEVLTDIEGIEVPAAEIADVSGGVRFVSDKPYAVSEVKITNMDTGETICCGSFDLGADHPELVAAEWVPWQRYTLSFKARRCCAADTERASRLDVIFGRKDDDNYLNWIIEGWAQCSSLTVMQDGRFSDIGMYYTPAIFDQDMEYKVEVNGPCMEVFVNGISREKAIWKMPVIEKLYYAASTESESGDLIVKAVNLQTEPITVQMNIKDVTMESADVWELAGYKHEDVNTFEAPEKVSPRQLHLETLPQEMTFAPESVTMIRIHKAENAGQ